MVPSSPDIPMGIRIPVLEYCNPYYWDPHLPYFVCFIWNGFLWRTRLPNHPCLDLCSVSNLGTVVPKVQYVYLHPWAVVF